MTVKQYNSYPSDGYYEIKGMESAKYKSEFLEESANAHRLFIKSDKVYSIELKFGCINYWS